MSPWIMGLHKLVSEYYDFFLWIVLVWGSGTARAIKKGIGALISVFPRSLSLPLYLYVFFSIFIFYLLLSFNFHFFFIVSLYKSLDSCMSTSHNLFCRLILPSCYFLSPRSWTPIISSLSDRLALSLHFSPILSLPLFPVVCVCLPFFFHPFLLPSSSFSLYNFTLSSLHLFSFLPFSVYIICLSPKLLFKHSCHLSSSLFFLHIF